MDFLVIFLVNGILDTVCEDWPSAHSAEAYLMTRHNDIEVVVILARDPWSSLTRTLDFNVGYNQGELK